MIVFSVVGSAWRRFGHEHLRLVFELQAWEVRDDGEGRELELEMGKEGG